MLNINLKDTELYTNDEIIIDKQYNIFYGKNGTGKSTLTREIVKQFSPKFDVRLFQGFEELLGDNNKLNAVALGRENVKIDNEIAVEKKKLDEYTKEKNRILRLIAQEDSDEAIIGKKLLKTKSSMEQKEKEFNQLYTTEAANIKKKINPVIVIGNYNKNTLISEINNAEELTLDGIKNFTDILKIDNLSATKIKVHNNLLVGMETSVNRILETSVKEKIVINRIKDNPEKISFAQKGLEIHSVGEQCAFCGSIIQKDIYDELNAYFLVDDVKKVQIEIDKKQGELQELKREIEQIQININNFYPEFKARVEDIWICLQKVKKDYNEHINKCFNALEEKKKNLFTVSEKIEISIMEDIVEFELQYNELVELNNSKNIKNQQDEARNKLRNNEIYKFINSTEYIEKKINLENAKKEYEKCQEEMLKEREKIYGENGLDNKIKIVENRISKLKQQSLDETKLADIINKKLKYMVSFELSHYLSEEGKGYYRVKDTYSSKYRDITQLSTGEKNIIAFLYFVEKLNEVQGDDSKIKIIVFDDPMNSNDDNMQYLIMEEIQNLRKIIKLEDFVIVLTHNKHFYINVKYGIGNNQNYWIESNGKETTIKNISGKEDFQTSYGALWKELEFLYLNNGASEGMLLNPIRRIIETYTKFNAIDHKEFVSHVEGALKLFNVNSHSIDDLEADLSGKTKKDIILLLKRCFEENKAINHFKKYAAFTDCD